MFQNSSNTCSPSSFTTLSLSLSLFAEPETRKRSDLPIMGNIMEACIQRKAEQQQLEDREAKIAGNAEKKEEIKPGVGVVIGGEEEEGSDNKKRGRVRVKVVLRKHELEWLLMHCRENEGDALEELLMAIQNSRRGLLQINHQKHHDRGWKPALDSIMEIPELQTIES